MKNALIENGQVVNIILGSSPGYVPVPDSVSIGDLFDGENFINPSPLRPDEYHLGAINHRSASRRKARQAALRGDTSAVLLSTLK